MNIMNLGRGMKGMNFNLNKLFNTNFLNFGMNNNNRGYNRCNATVISSDEAYNMIKGNPNVFIIDVRNKQEYVVSHLKKSINISVENIIKSVDILPRDRNCIIFLYCLNGSRASKAASMLTDMGYKNLYMWEGGSITTMPYGELIEYNK